MPDSNLSPKDALQLILHTNHLEGVLNENDFNDVRGDSQQVVFSNQAF